MLRMPQISSRFSPSSTPVKAACLVLAVLFLNACAVSPQYVDINPEIKVNSQVGSQQTVQVNVQDHRPENQLGTRGGVYANTSFIYPKGELSDSILKASNQALQDLGFSTTAASPNPVALTVHIDELKYLMDDSALPKKVTLSVKLRAEAVKSQGQQESRTSNRFGSSKTHSFMSTPGDAENEKIINEILSDTLNRLFNDPKLLEFMR